MTSESSDASREEVDSGQAPASCRATLVAFFEAGWPTPEVPLFLAGGYVTKERAIQALLQIADYVDRATNHPEARPEEAFAPAPERASA